MEDVVISQGTPEQFEIPMNEVPAGDCSDAEVGGYEAFDWEPSLMQGV